MNKGCHGMTSVLSFQVSRSSAGALCRPIGGLVCQQRSISSHQKVEIERPNEEDVIITDKYSTLKERYAPPKYPVVLCHGFMGFDTLSFFSKPKFLSASGKVGEQVEDIAENIATGVVNFEYWRGIKHALENAGTKVFIAKVPAFGTIEERAKGLESFINKTCRKLRHHESKSSIYNRKAHTEKNDKSFKESNKPIKINLVSHSMGGLDARYLISKLQGQNNDQNYQVVSLTTVSTPHHGSECADFLMDGRALVQYYPKCIEQLTTSYLDQFNKTVTDDPHVSYFSYGARMQPRWFNIFTPTWTIMRNRIIAKEGGTAAVDNDGLVSVKSAKWGKYLGTLDDVDHLDLINWTNTVRATMDKLVFNVKPKFNPVALYLDVAENLNKRGF